MTAQATESLIFRDEKLSLCDTPLTDFFWLSGRASPFKAPHTALWRGYIGTWEITEQRIYIIALRGYLHGGRHVDLSFLFPEHPKRVFAHWVTGTLRATRGKQLKYVHRGFASVYEQDVFFEFDDGFLKSVKVRDNTTATAENDSHKANLFSQY